MNDKISMFTVKKDGTGSSTIQAAINVASSGDTIWSTQAYNENIDYDGKNVVLGSLYMSTSDIISHLQ